MVEDAVPFRCATIALACAFIAVTTSCGSILYPAPSSNGAPAVQGAELLRLPIQAGEDAVAMWSPPAPGRSVVVFFHGNGTQIGDLGWLADSLRADGTGVLLVEYPGYGVAGGSPSEQAIYRSAARLLDELEQRGVDKAHTVLVGQSLGSAVAVEMAARGRGSRLLLISPFSSIPDLVDGMVPFGLGGVFVTDKFDSYSKARDLRVETVVVQGDEDSLVPIEMATSVAERIPGARLEVFEGAGHNDMFGHDGDRLIRLIRALAGPTAAQR
jgi:uncharacterized protein